MDITQQLERANKILCVTAKLANEVVSSNGMSIKDFLSIIGEGLNLQLVAVVKKDIMHVENNCVCDFWVKEEKSFKFENVLCNNCYRKGLSVCKCIQMDKPFSGKIKDLQFSDCKVKNVFASNLNEEFNISIIPLHKKNEVWGTICFCRENNGLWTNKEMEALNTIGQLLIVLIDKELEDQNMIFTIRKKFENLKVIAS
jgi:hypothetical protein